MRKLIFALFLLLFLAACGPATKDTPTTGETREFTMAARNWEFDPAVIEVNYGDKVIIHLYGEDDGTGAGHGVGMPVFGVNKVVRGGETVDVEFVADRRGTFPFICNVFCGREHGNMKGSLIVK